MKCSNCGTELDKDSTFCGECGTKVEHEEIVETPSEPEEQVEETTDNIEEQPKEENQLKKFCPKCGNEVALDATFCGSCGEAFNASNQVENPKKFCGGCGASVDLNAVACGSCGYIFPVQQAAPSIDLSKIKDFFIRIKDLIVKHKKIVIPIVVVIILALGGYFAYMNLHDFTKLQWDEDFGDYKIEYTASHELVLKAEAYDKEENRIKEIEYETEDGTVRVDGDVAYWTLPEEEGTYKITAKAPSGKKITHEVNLITIDDDENLAYELPELEDDEDEDGDGLTNKEEQEYKTDPYDPDTDSDGLIDSYEIQIKTDPLKADTDGDGLKDGAEVELKMDPLKESTLDDGVKDGDRTYETKLENDYVTVTLKGVGDVTSLTADVYDNTTLASSKGLLGKLYRISTNSKIDESTVVLKYDEERVLDLGLNEVDLTVYTFDIENKKLTPLESEVDDAHNTITFKTKEYNLYTIGSLEDVDIDASTQIMFIIDNSVSMYSEAQMIENGYNDSTGAIGSDTEFKRITLSNELIDLLNGNYEYGVSEFSGVYYNYNKLDKSKDTSKKSLNSIKNNFDHNEGGTDIVSAIKNGVSEFGDDSNNHYMILLTDGKDTTYRLSSSVDTLITTAKDKNVKVCVIGLGDVDKDDLTKIAEGTGCGFYYATDAKVLDEVYNALSIQVNYNLVDIDNDGEVDGTVIADSGFIPSRDGFSFRNFGTKNISAGHCYGMATVANFFYRDILPSYGSSISGGPLWGLKTKYYTSGYSFSYNSFFRNKDNRLYSYKLSDLAVIFDYRNISDYYDKVEDGTLKINSKYRKKIEELGGEIIVKDVSGKSYSKIERPYIDMENDKINSDSEDVNLIRALARYLIKQWSNSSYSFSSSPDKAFNQLLNDLNSDNPSVISVSYADGGHAVNVTRIISDLKDSNKFYIEIYDNNYPGEYKYITAYRTKYNKVALDFTAWTNDYKYRFESDNFKDIKYINVEQLEF